MELHTGQYMGQLAFFTNLGGIVLATSRHQIGVAVPAHHHANPHFTYVLEGSYEEAFAGQRVQCQRGDLLYHPAGFEHFNHFRHQGAACFNVEISPTCSLPGNALRTVQQHQVLAAPMLKCVMRSIIQEVELPDCFSDGIVMGLTLQLTGSFMREQRPRPCETRAVRRVKAMLNDVPHMLTLLEMSEVAGISPAYLCREFKRTTGLTPSEYARQQKVVRVCELLAQPHLTNEEIAFQMGFSDASHLSRVFKKVMGTTPGAYRNML